jgi:uncharacterized coiled-coil DUF342 family protein
MQDPSVLRRLALAFGEGLIFSVGMKLTEGATRPKEPVVATGPAPDLGSLAERLGRIEQRLQDMERQRTVPSQMDTKVVTAIVGALEKHLAQQAEKLNQRIDGLQATVIAAADTAAARRIERETAALRDQVQSMQRDMLSSISQIVATQVATQVSQQTAAMETKLQQSIEASVAPLRAEVRDLRRNIAETDSNLGELVSAISDTVRRTAETLPAPARAEGEWRGSTRLDLKALRKRLSDVDRNLAEPRFGLLPIPAAAQRRGPVPVRQFPVAS